MGAAGHRAEVPQNDARSRTQGTYAIGAQCLNPSRLRLAKFNDQLISQIVSRERLRLGGNARATRVGWLLSKEEKNRQSYGNE